MNPVDYILDGLEAELELERELGLRTVEIDRTLLAAPGSAGRTGSSGETRGSSVSSETRSSSVSSETRGSGTSSDSGGLSGNQKIFDFVFLHDRPLSSKGNEMMAKIILAMKKSAETAPVIVAPPRPKAKVSVVLGAGALRRWFPGVNAAPGQWVRTGSGEELLVTYSPEYILRFGTVTPAVEKIKREMWTSLKGVMQRV